MRVRTTSCPGGPPFGMVTTGSVPNVPLTAGMAGWGWLVPLPQPAAAPAASSTIATRKRRIVRIAVLRGLGIVGWAMSGGHSCAGRAPGTGRAPRGQLASETCWRLHTGEQLREGVERGGDFHLGPEPVVMEDRGSAAVQFGIADRLGRDLLIALRRDVD